ncbi:MAG: glycosyltransferase [Syntrophales bacterium]
MNPLKILHVTHSLDMGGLERVVVDLARGLTRVGHRVDICCLNGRGTLAEEAEREGIMVYSLKKKPGVEWLLPVKLSKIIRRGYYDIVHTHNEAGAIYGVPAAVLSNVKNIVHTEHGKEPSYRNKRRLCLAEKCLLRMVDRIVTVSKNLKDYMAASMNMEPDCIRVILNGIDISKFSGRDRRTQMRKSLGIANEDFVIGTISRIVPLKNHEFLLNIFKELRNHVPGIRLVIVGDGPLRDDIEKSALDKGIGRSVYFLGERRDTPELLSLFDLFMLPSFTEGVSLTLLEAMAAGVPVIASDVGGNSEVIEKGISGILIRLDNPAKWIEETVRLIRKKEERMEISSSAVQSVKKRFGVEIMIAEYEKVYQEVLEKTPDR